MGQHVTCLINLLAAKVGNLYRRGWRKLSTHSRQQLLGFSVAGFQPLHLLETRAGLLPLTAIYISQGLLVETGHLARPIQGFASRRQKPFGIGEPRILRMYTFKDVDYHLPLLTLMKLACLSVQLV